MYKKNFEWIKYTLLIYIMINALGSAFCFATNKKTLRFEVYNYADEPLPYITQHPLIGQLYLPANINQAPDDGSPAIANGLIESDNPQREAAGFFKIGFDEDNYCEFKYDIQDSVPIKPINSTGQLTNSCQVDPDTHRHIIINQQ